MARNKGRQGHEGPTSGPTAEQRQVIEDNAATMAPDRVAPEPPDDGRTHIEDAAANMNLARKDEFEAAEAVADPLGALSSDDLFRRYSALRAAVEYVATAKGVLDTEPTTKGDVGLVVALEEQLAALRSASLDASRKRAAQDELLRQGGERIG